MVLLSPLDPLRLVDLFFARPARKKVRHMGLLFSVLLARNRVGVCNQKVLTAFLGHT